MYFGQPIRRLPNAPAGGFSRMTYAPLTRGVSARTMSPVTRGLPPPRPTAPSTLPSAWQQMAVQQRAARQTSRLQTLQRENARDAALRAEIRRIAAERGGMTEAQARALFLQMQAAQPQVSVQTPPTPAATTPTPGVSPGSPEADLRPTQDAADGGEQPEAAPPSKKKFIFIGLAVAAVAGVGFVVLRKKKKPKAP